MIGTGTHITFVGTLVIASILTCGHSQSRTRPEHSAKHIQFHGLSKATQRVAINIASKLQSTTVEMLVKDSPIHSFHKPRNFAAIKQQEPKDVDRTDRQTELKVTPVIADIMNKVRPKQITGIITVEGKEYEFGSGGRGQSIPYGDYPITPDAVGSWGSKHGAIGVANGSIPDSKLRRNRDGIELHAATNTDLKTDGCVSIRKDQWSEFRQQVLAMVRENKMVYLHVSDQRASVSTEPLEFIGEAIFGPTLMDVLSLFKEPTPSSSDGHVKSMLGSYQSKPSRQEARAMRHVARPRAGKRRKT